MIRPTFREWQQQKLKPSFTRDLNWMRHDMRRTRADISTFNSALKSTAEQLSRLGSKLAELNQPIMVIQNNLLKISKIKL